jgi:hypothetical protein
MNILKSALFGLVLIVGSCILLFWAEGRAVKTARSLEEGSGIVLEVSADKLDPANEGKLVHISGDAVPQEIPADKRLGVEAKGAMSLTRVVEMLQWKEIERDVERKDADGKVTKTKVYDYDKTWSDKLIDSSRFKMATAPKNPEMPLNGESFTVAAATVGAFTLSGNDVARLGKKTPVQLSDSGAASVVAAIGGTKPIWLVGNRFLLADNADQPQVGDIRIGYERGDVSRLSAIGKQIGGRLGPYTTSNGRDVFLIQAGNASASEMFKDAIAGNTALTWGLRVIGLLAMFFGFSLSFSPLTGTLGRLPVVGGLLRGGASLVALALTLALGSIVIALGWIFYRPLLALVIVVIGVGLAFAIGKLGKQPQAQAARPQ